jgi:hypothetical protein
LTKYLLGYKVNELKTNKALKKQGVYIMGKIAAQITQVGTVIYPITDSRCVAVKATSDINIRDTLSFQSDLDSVPIHKETIKLIKINLEAVPKARTGDICDIRLNCPPDKLPPSGTLVFLVPKPHPAGDKASGAESVGHDHK